MNSVRLPIKKVFDHNKLKRIILFLAAGLTCFDLNLNLTPHIGRVNRTSLNANQINELINKNSINGDSIFSYAFVRSANRGENFSYTII